MGQSQKRRPGSERWRSRSGDTEKMIRNMKRIITLVLLMAVALPAAAADGTEDPITQEVWASYRAGTADRPVISIDISWEQMSFTYADTSAPAWNPETHRYEGETTEGGWQPGAGVITVRNNSNAIAHASIAYRQEDAYGAVDMRFTDSAPYIGSAHTGDRTDGEGNVCGTPCQIAVRMIPVGTLSGGTGDPVKIGTVSVTVDTDVDTLRMLDEVNNLIDLYPVADGAELARGTVHFVPGTDKQELYALTEAALVAYRDGELAEPEKNAAINEALTAFYGALDIAQ